MNRQTFNDRVEVFFREHAGEWIHASRLEGVGGRQAWRTRVSDVRRTRGLEIENRTRRVKRIDGEVITISEYRWLPPVPVQASLLDEERVCSS